MKAVLILIRPDGQRREFPLAQGVTIIGRGEACTLRIPVMEVSRKHCELTANNGALELRDLGSSNGTYVNGKRVLEYKLKPGDQLQIGEVTFTVQIDGKPAEIPAAPKAAAKPAAKPPALKPEEASAAGADEISPDEVLDSSDLDLGISDQSGDFGAFLDDLNAADDADDGPKSG